ncbi:MAG: lytic transglycosylase domain-containing protein [Firmicutes bacterium]|nr:lytic transglycosylase domain-containing protein [Bacillota bacterium]
MKKFMMGSRFFYLLLFLICTYLLFSRAGYFIQKVYPFHHREIIIAEAHKNQLEPHLVAAVIFVESSFNEKAQSAKGARGLMQIMPETGRWAAGQLAMENFTDGQLFEPQVNIALGTWYLRNLLLQFNGNIYLALAAYNGGRSNVTLWLQKEIWDGQRKTLRNIPFPETRYFVLKVERIYQRYKQIYKEIDV